MVFFPLPKVIQYDTRTDKPQPSELTAFYWGNVNSNLNLMTS